MPAPSSPSSGRTRRQPESEDDADLVLPPLDADEPEGDASEIASDEVLDEFDERDGRALDDAVASDLDIGDELDDDLGEESDADGADEPLDVGPLDDGFVDAERAGAEDDAAWAEDDDDIDESLLADEDDGGAEGTGEPAEMDIEEDPLPDLDADDEGDFEDDELIRELLPERREIAWSTAPWMRREGAGARLSCDALSVAHGRVAAAGDVLLVVDEGADAARQACSGTRAVALSVGEKEVLLATPRGALLSCALEGGHPKALAAWRPARGVYEMASTPGRTWVRCGESLCFLAENDAQRVDPRSSPWSSVTSSWDRGVVAIASSQSVLLALRRLGEEAQIERLRGDDEGHHSITLAGDALDCARAETVRIATTAEGRAIALCSPRNGVCISRNGGLSFSTLPLPSVLSVAFAGEGDDAPLLVLMDHHGGARIALVPKEGEASIVAELAPSASDDEESEDRPDDDRDVGQVAAMAWDTGREVLWVASRLGLMAFGPARRH